MCRSASLVQCPSMTTTTSRNISPLRRGDSMYPYRPAPVRVADCPFSHHRLWFLVLWKSTRRKKGVREKGDKGVLNGAQAASTKTEIKTNRVRSGECPCPVLVRAKILAASTATNSRAYRQHRTDRRYPVGTLTHFTCYTTVVIPKGERPGHTGLYPFLLFVDVPLRSAWLGHRTCLCAGRIPLSCLFGLNSSLGFIDSIRK